MRLPNAAYADGIGKGKQSKFGGLNHNPGAGDGEIYAMKNLCSDHYPLLATRAPRMSCGKLTKGNGLFAWESLAWVDGTSFYYNGTLRGQVSDGEKSFAAIDDFIIIMPDKLYYNVATQAFGSLEASVTAESVSFQDGTIYGESAEANTVYAAAIDWADYFKAGDAITISGASTEENNISAIIREIDGHAMRFYENSFTNSEETNVSFKREVPTLKYMCENENRLWGCDDTDIYASKLGDPFNFNVFDGLDTDSYAVDAGSSGKFTGCISFLGYPTFFKEQHIYKVYGSLPSNYEVMGSATLGLAPGSWRSLAVAGEALFYLSYTGVCMYTGGIPQPIGRPFGTERYKNAVGGSDGLKYYVSMQDSANAWHLFVYDTQRGLWHEEDNTHAKYFAYAGGNLYFLNSEGDIWITGRIQDAPAGATAESAVSWGVEFTDFTEDNPNKKGVSALQIRLELETGASCTAYFQADSSGTWIKPNGGEISTSGKRSVFLPIVPQRADHYRLKLEGSGGCKIYSIARESYQGSELKSQQGRQ